MSQPTYKRTMSGSLGSGMKSLFGGEGRRFYTLEHKVSSKYHKAGEAQRIIVDQIEIGRSSTCQVRFDDSFVTVSAKHAAIVRDGDNWKLIHLSKTNPTYLNGHRVEKEWYLQNGDEIQLATNGPKLGFIIPQGDKGLVKSIGLTARLNLFRQQALRPYKTAITALACLLVVGAGVTGALIRDQHKEITELNRMYAQAQDVLESIKDENNELSDAIEYMEEKARQQDSIIEAARKEINRIKSAPPQANVAHLIESVRSSVYFIVTTVYVKTGNETRAIGASSGTGFLLKDGRFVTARHCVESWLFGGDDYSMANMMDESYDNVTVWSEIEAYGENDNFTLRSSDFTIDRSMDVIMNAGTDDYGNPMKMRLAFYIRYEDPETGEVMELGDVRMGGTDWAVAKIGKRGTIEHNASLSTSLTQGTEVHVLGFPAALGAGDGQNNIEPIYNKMNVARNGLNSQGCIMVSQGVAHGNSGGPVFAVKDGRIYAVAIVSRLESATQLYNDSGTAIEQQQQQYDQLVPISAIE